MTNQIITKSFSNSEKQIKDFFKSLYPELNIKYFSWSNQKENKNGEIKSKICPVCLESLDKEKEFYIQLTPEIKGYFKLVKTSCNCKITNI